MEAVKAVAARVFLAIVVCFLALQWLSAGVAAHSADASAAHAELSAAGSDKDCGAGHCDGRAGNSCTSAALIGGRTPQLIEASRQLLPEPDVLFADHFPALCFPPPLPVST